ncbi:Hypp9023 [Branchiostoma lanceolatum]|uniref:Hypp9023 protein n=1 Tax=Branchiostoma lanceolatum TaxID=7740 RepID=A0A8J9ZCS1_BRALA|nr:Hypp9023 [Branchiostoma lanceolatum]
MEYSSSSSSDPDERLLVVRSGRRRSSVVPDLPIAPRGVGGRRGSRDELEEQHRTAFAYHFSGFKYVLLLSCYCPVTVLLP